MGDQFKNKTKQKKNRNFSKSQSISSENNNGKTFSLASPDLVQLALEYNYSSLSYSELSDDFKEEFNINFDNWVG